VVYSLLVIADLVYPDVSETRNLIHTLSRRSLLKGTPAYLLYPIRAIRLISVNLSRLGGIRGEALLVIPPPLPQESPARDSCVIQIH